MQSGSRTKQKKASGSFTDAPGRLNAPGSAGRATLEIDPDEEFKELRAKLLKRGHSLRSFAITHGYKVQTVYSAAKRTRAGRKSLPIFEHICRFVNAPKEVKHNES
jgi:hypothetical protein